MSGSLTASTKTVNDERGVISGWNSGWKDGDKCSVVNLLPVFNMLILMYVCRHHCTDMEQEMCES